MGELASLQMQRWRLGRSRWTRAAEATTQDGEFSPLLGLKAVRTPSGLPGHQTQRLANVWHLNTS